MFRLLGFATGAALTIGAIALVMGLPELRTKTAPASVDETPAEHAPIVSEPVSDPKPEPISEHVDEFVPGPPSPATTDEPPRDIADETATGPHWHSFWNPFRSEIAANGFAARLTAVTGIDYRVVRLEPGRYQVAFAYVDSAERAAKIEQIELATGLELPESAP